MAQSTVKYPKRDVVDLTEEAPIQVLHVDDEVGFLKAAKQILEMQGNFQVETATSVEEATEKMKKETYDAIVCDYMMPGKDGLEFLKELRDSGNNIPFIIFTGKGRQEVAIEALNLGAEQYLNKIGDPETVYGELAYGIRKGLKAKEAEAALKQSEEKYRNLVEKMPVVMYSLDTAGNFTSVNKAAKTMLGFEPEEMIGRNFAEFLTKEALSQAMADSNENDTEKEITTETTMINKDRKTLNVECKSTPIITNGKVAGFQGILRDITERKKAEDALRQSEEKYRNIFELAPDGIITIDLKGVVTSVNPTFLKLTGYSKEEIVGKHFTKLGTFRARDIPRYLKLMHSALKGKLPSKFEYSYVRKNGTVGWAEGHFGLLRKNGKITGFQGILREVTKYKEAQKALDETEERYRTLMEETPVGILNIDMKGKITYANKKLEEITGYPRKEIVGKSWLNLARKRGMLSEETLKSVAKRIRTRLMGRPAPPIRIHLTHKDGSKIWVEGESKAIKKFAVPVGLQASSRDITELMKADKALKKTLAKLETLNEKLSVVGRLARHDARNKLSAVTMNVFLAKQKLAGDHEALEHLGQIESACGDVERIFDFASIYEKIGSEELAYVDVEKSLGEVVRLFSDLQGVKVVNDCFGLTVLADSLLRRLFYNLIDNSLKHGKRVSQIRVHYEKMGKDKLKLVYDDDGVGIPKAEKEKIFKEGYGEDSGHGLYLIRKMCEVYEWTIQETGKQGKGAQFTITIPKMNREGKISYKIR